MKVIDFNCKTIDFYNKQWTNEKYHYKPPG